MEDLSEFEVWWREACADCAGDELDDDDDVIESEYREDPEEWDEW